MDKIVQDKELIDENENEMDKSKSEIDKSFVDKSYDRLETWLGTLHLEELDEYLLVDADKEPPQEAPTDIDWKDVGPFFAEFITLHKNLLSSKCWNKMQFFILTKYRRYVDYRAFQYVIIAFIETILPDIDMRDKAMLLRANHGVQLKKVTNLDHREALRKARIEKTRIDN